MRTFPMLLLAAAMLGSCGCGVIAPEKRRATDYIWRNSTATGISQKASLGLTSVLTLAVDGLISNPIRGIGSAWSDAGYASSKMTPAGAAGAVLKPIAFTLCFIGDEVLYCTIPNWGLSAKEEDSSG